jgi:hypothetical protein
MKIRSVTHTLRLRLANNQPIIIVKQITR